MLNETEAIQKAKEAFRDYTLESGTLCGRTYAFTATKNGELVYGCLCIDAKTGDPCGSPDIMKLTKAFQAHSFTVI